MKKLFALFLLIASHVGFAHATAVVTDLSYDERHIRFTILGDLTGYAVPTGELATNYLSILYTGNLLPDPVEENNWYSGEIAAGYGPDPTGYTGGFGVGMNYTWMMVWQLTPTIPLSGTPFEVSWYSPVLNPNGTGEIQFLWGNPYSNVATLIQSFAVKEGVIGSPAAVVPEPETYTMLLAGIAFIGMAARRRRSALLKRCRSAEGRR